MEIVKLTAHVIFSLVLSFFNLFWLDAIDNPDLRYGIGALFVSSHLQTASLTIFLLGINAEISGWPPIGRSLLYPPRAVYFSSLGEDDSPIAENRRASRRHLMDPIMMEIISSKAELEEIRNIQKCLPVAPIIRYAS